jgi:hypothetical protein
MPGILFSVQQAVLMRDALAGPQETMCVYVRSYTAVASVGEKKGQAKVQGKQKKEKHFPNVESRFGNRTDVTHTSSALVPCCCVKGLQDEVAHIMHAPRIVLWLCTLMRTSSR